MKAHKPKLLEDAVFDAAREQIEQAIKIYADVDELSETQSDYAMDLASRVVSNLGGFLSTKENRDEERAEEKLTYLGGIEDRLEEIEESIDCLVVLFKSIGWLYAAEYRDRHPHGSLPVEEQFKADKELFAPFI